MPNYTEEEFELYGFTKAEREVFDAFFLNTIKNPQAAIVIGIDSRLKEIAREEKVLADLIKESNDIHKKCEEDFNKKAEPLNKYHDLCVQSVIDRVKLFGYDAYHPKNYFIDGEDIFTADDYEVFQDIPREFDEDKKGKLRETIVERDKQIEKAREGAVKYLKTPLKTREDIAFEPYEKAMRDVTDQTNRIEGLKSNIVTLNSISQKLKSPINKEIGLNKLNDKRKEYNKINRASRFFSYFLPNAWTKAGKARNDIKSYENFLKGKGFSNAEISTGKLDKPVVKEENDVILDEPVERKSIEISELKNEGLNSSKENVVSETKVKEKEAAEVVEEPIVKGPQK